MSDMINHPPHYTQMPFCSEARIECLDITRHMDFCGGNAVKYLWRAGFKTEEAEQDIDKAMFYLDECARGTARSYRTALAIFSLIGDDHSDRYAAIKALLQGDAMEAMRKAAYMLNGYAEVRHE